MARIIYKEGCEGQNRFESIEGIEIELFNGQKALIYPKYEERALLEREKISKWGAPEESEIEALKLESTAYETGQLFALDSPAAMWIAQFRSDKYGIFNLPSLLAAMEIQHQKSEIDALAETIEGADLLRVYTSLVWSCSRYNKDSGWIAYGNYGFAGNDYLCYSRLVIPAILY